MYVVGDCDTGIGGSIRGMNDDDGRYRKIDEW